LETDAGLTVNRSTSSAAVKLPVSLMHRAVSTLAGMGGTPVRTITAVSWSSNSRTAAGSRP
jgi:hypothetical protein